MTARKKTSQTTGKPKSPRKEAGGPAKKAERKPPRSGARRPTKVDPHFARALENIKHFGDTDVFPFPPETRIFADLPDEALGLLKAIHRDFTGMLLQMPPTHDRTLAAVGYTGFRAATQLDPIWNAYLLGLVLSIGSDIEGARLSKDKEAVYSYRFNPDSKEPGLFDPDTGWAAFRARAAQLASQHSFALSTDISDFYPRVYHHRLENALKRCTKQKPVVTRIMTLLKNISGGVSYGLPVGGPAARLLSELVLDSVDRLLMAKGIPFCRFVDDYRIFAGSREEAYARLVFLSEALLSNEGLSLQKTKTRVLTAEEYLATTELLPEPDPEDEHEKETRSFLSLSIHYDPYSETADDDYRELQRELRKFDVPGMLAREVAKPQIHESLTRRLIRTIRYLRPSPRDAAIDTLLENFGVLYPVFPTVSILVRALMTEVSPETRDNVLGAYRQLIHTGSHIVKVPVNLAHAVPILACDRSVEADALLHRVYEETSSIAVRRDVIVAMINRGAAWWISDKLRRYANLTAWERRALIVGSYALEDEGAYWRKSAARDFNALDKIVIRWASRAKEESNGEIAL